MIKRMMTYVIFILLVSCSKEITSEQLSPVNDQPTLVTKMLSPAASTKTEPPLVDASPTSIQTTLTPTMATTPYFSIAAASPSATYGPYLSQETYTPTVVRTTVTIQMTPDPIEMNFQRWVSKSPDKKWIAKGIIAWPKPESAIGMWYTQLLILSADGKTNWKVVDSWHETGLGSGSPQPVDWSINGLYFYYTNVPAIEGCIAINPNGSDLLKVSVETGMKEEILSQGASWISLSNYKNLLAYYKGNNLYIRDLNSELEYSVPIDPGLEFNLGYIVWSPDDKRIAFTLALSPCKEIPADAGMAAQTTSIIVMEIANMQTITLLKEDARLLRTFTWKDPKTLELIDNMNHKWLIDIQTKRVQSP